MAILSGGLPPHLCHGHNCGSANPPFKNPAYGPEFPVVYERERYTSTFPGATDVAS